MQSPNMHRVVCLAAAAVGLAALLSPSAFAAPAPFPPREERGSLVLEGIPPTDTVLAQHLEDWTGARGAHFQDFLPDGGLLITTRFGDSEQVHRVAQPLGAREQLTFFRDPVSGARAPQTAQAPGFVLLKDRGGDENWQLHYYRFADRSLRMLTDGRARHGSPVWSPDGARVAFYGTGRDGTSYDIYVADIASTAAPRLVVAGENRSWYPVDWSPDGQKLLLVQENSINDARLFVAQVDSGALTPVPVAPPGAAAGETVGIRAAKFSADGRAVWVSSDAGSEFAQLREIDLATGSSRSETAFLPWDVEELAVGSDGRFVAWLANVDGTSRIGAIDLGARSELTPRGLPAGVIADLRFDRAGKRLGMTIESAQSPPDAWTWDLERDEATRWTRSETGAIDPARYVPASLVHFPTWDRADGKPRQLAAFVYRPRTPGVHPVLVDIHGGPESQARPRFSPFLQFLVDELGYVVVQPNVRGSAGYGKTFLKLDDALLREDAVRDIGALLVWIGAQPDMDGKRVAVMGGSYGGYMALAALASYGDRLRGGIDVVGISNFVTFLQNTSAYRRDQRRAEYGDERVPRIRSFLTRVSPLTNAAMIKRPLLVVQGLNDPRVPASESEQMVARVRLNGGEVWYLAAKDEGHGFRRKSNRDVYLATAAQFLARLRAD
jgi:dipeptidyl aminopeptidase/acylaminoacyl peptidase